MTTDLIMRVIVRTTTTTTTCVDMWKRNNGDISVDIEHESVMPRHTGVINVCGHVEI